MLWANKNNERIMAKPKIKDASCPLCKEFVISKCGQIKIWHWAHKSKKQCDDWYEPESEWHINWKKRFPKECQEVRLGKHIADIKTPIGVIELQNSSISYQDIAKREMFYGNMIWVLNGDKFAKNLEIRKKGSTNDQFNIPGSSSLNKEWYTFRWKHPHKSWWYADKPIFIDMSKTHHQIELLLIRQIYHDLPCGGWGKEIKIKDFINRFMVSGRQEKNMTDEWTERVSDSNMWLPKKLGEELIGKVKECIEEGMYGKNWVIETKDGEITTPSHKVLQNRMNGIEIGTEVKIVYDGEESSGKGNPTRIYKVFTKGA